MRTFAESPNRPYRSLRRRAVTGLLFLTTGLAVLSIPIALQKKLESVRTPLPPPATSVHP